MALFGTGAVTFTGTQFTELAAAIPEFSKQTGHATDGLLGAGGTHAIQNGGTGTAIYQHSATPPSANYSVWADIAKLSGNTGNGPRMGVCGRMAAGADTFYFALYSHDLTNIRLFKRVAGGQTQLGSSHSFTLTSTPAKLELVMDGSSISAKLNDVTVIGPVADTEITGAGRAGVYLFDMRETGVADSGALDNFDAAAISSGPSFTTQPSNQTVTAPNTASFSWASSGAIDGWQVQQRRGGGAWANVTDGTGQSGGAGTNVSGTYTTTATAVSTGNHRNGDEYRVVLNPGGSAVNSNAAVLTVNAPPLAITSDPLRDQNDALLASATLTRAYAIRISDHTLVANWAAPVTNASGVLTLSNAALTAAPHLLVTYTATGLLAGAQVYTPA